MKKCPLEKLSPNSTGKKYHDKGVDISKYPLPCKQTGPGSQKNPAQHSDLTLSIQRRLS